MMYVVIIRDFTVIYLPFHLPLVCSLSYVLNWDIIFSLKIPSYLDQVKSMTLRTRKLSRQMQFYVHTLQSLSIVLVCLLILNMTMPHAAQICIRMYRRCHNVCSFRYNWTLFLSLITVSLFAFLICSFVFIKFAINVVHYFGLNKLKMLYTLRRYSRILASSIRCQ